MENRHLIDPKWVFNKKRNGQYRAHLVSWGYTQIKGVYLTKNYSPVINDITLCAILLMWLINKWYSQTVDFGAQFLYAVLK